MDANQNNTIPVIIINGRPYECPNEIISFEVIIQKAFEQIDPNKIYLITYAMGPVDNPEGEMAAGSSVRIKDGMVFNATPTDKS